MSAKTKPRNLYRAGARMCRTGGNMATLTRWLSDNLLTAAEAGHVVAGYRDEKRFNPTHAAGRRLGNPKDTR